MIRQSISSEVEVPKGEVVLPKRMEIVFEKHESCNTLTLILLEVVLPAVVGMNGVAVLIAPLLYGEPVLKPVPYSAVYANLNLGHMVH